MTHRVGSTEKAERDLGFVAEIALRGRPALRGRVAAQRPAARARRAPRPSPRSCMCGIAGVLDRDGRARPARGPAADDATRSRTAGRTAKATSSTGRRASANRRLAIIDLSPAGHSRWRAEDGSLVITYNGEIYNFRELRAELERLGHAFRSHTDTEVVLTRLRASGAPAASSASTACSRFAIWDRDQRELFLARDRYGIKPLYYAEAGAALLFGSEIKALLAHDAFRAERQPRAPARVLHVPEHLHRRHAVQGRAAAARRPSRDDRAPTAAPCGPSATGTSTSASPSGDVADPREYEEELDRLFRQAVERQLVTDVPVGAYLSGGMDSGSITALAAQQLPYLNTFTVGFDMTSACGIELRHRRAREGRGDVLPLQDRALRDGAQGGRHGALHAGARCGTSRTRASARATRTTTSRGSPASS